MGCSAAIRPRHKNCSIQLDEESPTHAADVANRGKPRPVRRVACSSAIAAPLPAGRSRNSRRPSSYANTKSTAARGSSRARGSGGDKRRNGEYAWEPSQR